ncbi:hypothetical protein ACEQ8H_006894 [Pleosporales sp. CAS-2024a]
MAWGILESKLSASPRGTSRLGLEDIGDVLAQELDTSKRTGGVVLSPQPSDDPNDPLNWTSAMLTPGLEPLTKQFHSNDADVSTWIITAPTFWTSAAAFIVVAGTDIWGRRPFYVWSIVFLALSNFAAYFSTTFAVLTFARTSGGLFSAPLLTLVTATISDIFFVHQRGSSIAVWNLPLNSGAQVGQVLAGLVTDRVGVSANFLITAIIFTAIAPVFYLSIFESAYFTRQVSDATMTRIDKLSDEYDNEHFKDTFQPPKHTYTHKLTLFPGRISDQSFFKA